MRLQRLLAWIVAALLAGGAALPATAALVDVPINGVSCLLSVDVVRCGSLEAPTPTPRPVASPAPTTVLVGGCPRDAYDLRSPLPAQPTLLGYDMEVYGRRTFSFCGRTTVSSTRGGNLGAAWLDFGGSSCTKLQIRLLSYNGSAVVGGTTGQPGGTPQLTYRFLFPGGRAPAGEYSFEIEADSTDCPEEHGRFRTLWTP